MKPSVAEVIEREVVALLLGVLLIALVVVPRNAAATVALVALFVAPALIAIARRHGEWKPSRASLVVIAAGGAVAALALATAVFAATPAVAVWGVRGQRTGAALWVGLFVLFAVLVVRGRRGDLVRSSSAIAVFSAVLAVSALLESAGLLSAVRLADSSSGLAENSISLAQVLTIGAGCACLWALRARTSAQRVIAWACVALALAGVAVSNTRSAWVALVIAVALIALSRLAAVRFRLGARWLATGAVLFVVVALGATLALGAVGQSSALGARADSVLSGRVGIWEAATAKVVRTLAVGSGPEQFSAWATWDSQPLADIEKVSTDDPHSIVLYWLLAAGVPGLIGFLALGWLAAERMAAALTATRWQAGMMALTCGLGAWGVQLLSAWTSPLAAMCAVMVFAAVLGALDSGAAEQGAREATGMPEWVGTAAAVSLAVVALVGFARVGSAEVEWARALSQGAAPGWERMAQLAESSGDPSYAIDASAGAHDAVVATRDAAVLTGSRALTEPMLQAAAGWSVGAAFQVNQMQFDSVALGTGGSWDDVRATIALASAADPTSGLWHYLGAAEATLLKHEADAREYASKALEFWLPDAVRVWAEGIADGG